MSRKQRTILLVFAVWSFLIGVPGVWLWQVDRQERLNRALIAAIKRGDTSSALDALEKGANGNARDEPRVTAWKRLWGLVQGRRSGVSDAPTALLLLLERRDTQSAHFLAKESPELVSALLAHGAQVNVIDEAGFSPLFYALEVGQKRTARLLINRGANVTTQPNRVNPLVMEITGCRDTALAELMIQHGADVNSSGHPSMWSPISAAVYSADKESVRLLLRHHAYPNPTLETDVETEVSGKPLKYAEDHHLTEIAKLLRAAGAKR